MYLIIATLLLWKAPGLIVAWQSITSGRVDRSSREGSPGINNITAAEARNTRAAVPPYMSKMSRTGPVTTEMSSQSVSTRHSRAHQAAKQNRAQLQHSSGKGKTLNLNTTFGLTDKLYVGGDPRWG